MLRRTAPLAFALAALLALPAMAAKDDLVLVSVATGGAPGDNFSGGGAVSADGNRIAFASAADNLSAEDVDGRFNADVFLRDLAAGTTQLVSRATGALGAAGDGSSVAPSISADGTRIAFLSKSTNLSPLVLAGTTGIFLRDLTTATTTLVSRADGPDGPAADGSLGPPAISADGRRVAFVSGDNGLSTQDADGFEDVFVRDIAAQTTTLVSRAPGPGGAGGNRTSEDPAISATGRFVAFTSRASNLSDADPDADRDVFVRDLQNDLTTLVSRASGVAGAAGDEDSLHPSISGDGRFVAFASGADNLSSVDDDDLTDVFVRDRVLGTTTLVSRASGPSGAPSDGESLRPRISADGRYVAFGSFATNLVAAAADADADVFVRDLQTSTTILVTRGVGPAGAGLDEQISEAVLSADGRFAVFTADSALVPEDSQGFEDVYRRDVLGAPPAPPAPVVRCAGFRATIVGTPGRDVIRGTARRDVIHARGGDDLVRGLGGDDVICLGAGHDRGVGGRGFDRILGGAGRDVMLGGFGPDVLQGGPGRDRAIGGRGADLCRAERRSAC